MFFQVVVLLEIAPNQVVKVKENALNVVLKNVHVDRPELATNVQKKKQTKKVAINLDLVGITTGIGFDYLGQNLFIF